MIKAVLFDLDGTLLPMDEEKFVDAYFSLLSKKVSPLGYEKATFIQTIWNGTKLMYQNDGTKTNEEVFWDYFSSVYGSEKLNDKEVFDDFYVNEFKNIEEVCDYNPLARKIVECARENFDYLILSTNPIFPKNGTLTRMSFVDLREEDFDLITTYENSSFCKPNPKYFEEILQNFNLKPDEVILFGNNTIEDMKCANDALITCYLVGDYVINKENKKNIKVLKMEEVIPFLLKLKQEVK